MCSQGWDSILCGLDETSKAQKQKHFQLEEKTLLMIVINYRKLTMANSAIPKAIKCCSTQLIDEGQELFYK